MKSLLIWLSLIYSFILPAQNNIPIGTWRTHLSYGASSTIAVGDNKIFSGSENNLFYLEKEYNNLEKLTPVEGASEVSVSKLSYSPSKNSLIILYENLNIDLLSNNSFTNVQTLKNAAVSGQKKAHHILVANSSAFISTSFGLAHLDLNRNVIKEIYQYIGLNAASPEVYASAWLDGSLFLATSEGVLQGKFDPAVNLQDYHSWNPMSSSGDMPSGKVDGIASYEGKIYAAVNGLGFFVYEDSSWRKIDWPVPTKIHSMKVSEGQLFICQDNSILRVTGRDFELLALPSVGEPREAIAEGGVLWVADHKNGLAKLTSSSVEFLMPAGPGHHRTAKLFFGGEKVLGFPDTTGLSNETFYSFQNGSWKNYTPEEIGFFTDISDAVFNPTDNSWYLGSFSKGLLNATADQPATTFNSSNSPLISRENSNTSVSSVGVDTQGNIWMINKGVGGATTLQVKKQDSSWQNFPLNHSQAAFISEILIDFSGNKWLRIDPQKGGGILVYNESSGRLRYLSTQQGQGGLHTSKIYDLAIDKSGSVWAATDDGVTVFYPASDVLEGSINANRPVFGTQYLLKDNRITCIHIDEGDRKWIGTDNGVWLFNEDASELVARFTNTTSPMLSDLVRSITTDNKTGEVFFVTEKGIISYRADATESVELFTNVKIFPNPVPSGYNGILGISGLSDNSTIKITTLTGRLVYETKSAGGTASWNLSGMILSTGVYLVFSISENGEETQVSKFTAIR